MRGLTKNYIGRGQTNVHTDIATLTDPAQRAKSVKILNVTIINFTKVVNFCDKIFPLGIIVFESK